MSKSTTIRVVIFKDGEHWVAQCLEYDIAAQATDLDTLRSRLLVAVEAEAQASREFTGAEFGGIGEAPQAYRDLWNKASRFRNESALQRDGGYTVDLRLAA